MTYTFTGSVIKQGSRYFIKIPFNIWEECKQKGSVAVKVSIQNHLFECKLMPKGKGIYYLPITKSVLQRIDNINNITVSFDVIDSLTRINHHSPYTKENPIRKINHIKKVTYSKAGYCGQLCLAMLTGLDVEVIINKIQAKAWQCSLSKIIETLDYFGISHADKFTYIKGKEINLPQCCIVNIREEPHNHVSLYYKGKYYDTTDFDSRRIISYLKIDVE